VTIGQNIAAYVPLLSVPSQLLIFGGLEVSQNTLLRFYVLHVILLPLTAAVFLAVHFWRIRKDGGISGPL
jgi:quinol-cytochrome oxidoreductase complex cytochrome b subunit